MLNHIYLNILRFYRSLLAYNVCRALDELKLIRVSLKSQHTAMLSQEKTLIAKI